MTTTPDTNPFDDIAVQALSNEGAMCGDCGDQPGDRICPDCERHRRRYVTALRKAGWAPISEAADLIDAMLTAEPDHTRASALYEALLKLRVTLPCTCARSQGLHEKQCRKYVPGHELLSPVRALAAYQAERTPVV